MSWLDSARIYVHVGAYMHKVDLRMNGLSDIRENAALKPSAASRVLRPFQSKTQRHRSRLRRHYLAGSL